MLTVFAFEKVSFQAALAHKSNLIIHAIRIFVRVSRRRGRRWLRLSVDRTFFRDFLFQFGAGMMEATTGSILRWACLLTRLAIAPISFEFFAFLCGSIDNAFYELANGFGRTITIGTTAASINLFGIC